MSAPVFTIEHVADYSARPFCDPAKCPHPGPMILSINQGLVPNKGGRRVTADGCVCLDCGSDALGRLGLVEGLQLAMHEYGWHRGFGERLHDVAAHRRADMAGQMVPAWIAEACGLSRDEMGLAFRRGRAVRYLEDRAARSRRDA